MQWDGSSDRGIPTLKISLDGEVILEEDFQEFIEAIVAKYPPGSGQIEPAPEDLIWKLDSDELELVFIVRSLQISGIDMGPYTYLDLATILINEKP